MFWMKLVLVIVLGVATIFASTLWDSTVSPGFESDLAIAQMEMDDGAATELRVASRTLAYQYPLAFIFWATVSALIFNGEIRQGIYYLKEELEN